MIILLKSRTLIQVTGKDAENFLQSQFTNDIKSIQEKKIQINAYCQHQGKIIVLIWVFKMYDNFYLSFPADLKEIVIDKLNMFKMMSEVYITDVSSEFYQYGLISENHRNGFYIKNNLSLLITPEVLDTCSERYWNHSCIENFLPEIYHQTTEKFIPQALNLDIDEIGVSFNKGCYPGQEVVARMHYLGKPKRRLIQFSSNFEVFIGDTINVKDSKSLKSSGVVLLTARTNEQYHSLAIFEMEYIDKEMVINDNIEQKISIINE